MLICLAAGCATDDSVVQAPPSLVPNLELQVTEVKGPGSEQVTFVVPPRLQGEWISEQPEPAGNGRYAFRRLKFDGSHWELTYTLSLGRSQAKLLFQHRAKGLYNLQKASSKMDGAFLVAFRNLQKSISLEQMDRTTQKELGFDSCGLTANHETDITSRGCGIVMKVAECPTDFDLIRQETYKGKTRLYLGNRYAEFASCSEDKRPVALGPPLIPVNDQISRR